MALFQKLPKPASTVAEAIAPFRQVKDNLGSVLGEAARVKHEAAKRIADARAYANEVEQSETERAESASAEQAQAEKILKALSAILGEDA